MICAARRNRCGDSPATVCRARSIRSATCKHWPTHCNSRVYLRSWNASTSQIFPRRMSSLRWFVSAMECPTRIITGVTGSGPWQGQDDFASMAEVVRRRYSRVLLEAARNRTRKPRNSRRRQPVEGLHRLEKRTTRRSTPSRTEIRIRPVRLPDLIIVDGGKGQLSSACRELQRLGLHELPIIGLAKEFEEIYRPGRALPLQLPPDSGALRLLQRIRDEAHRFANTYHQLLMKKRIGESILDDCPGVSQNRKSLLLRKFGSVNRLRKATVAQIAATEGIGPKLAEEVHRFLQRH